MPGTTSTAVQDESLRLQTPGELSLRIFITTVADETDLTDPGLTHSATTGEVCLLVENVCGLFTRDIAH